MAEGEDGGDLKNGGFAGRGPDGRFLPGNSGKPKGSRNHASIVIEQLMEGAAERITRKALRMAAHGDGAMIRLIIERIAPPVRRDRPVRVELPEVRGVEDHPAALAALVAAVASGELAPAEAQAVAALFAEHRAAIEVASLEARIAALEARQAAPGRRTA